MTSYRNSGRRRWLAPVVLATALTMVAGTACARPGAEPAADDPVEAAPANGPAATGAPPPVLPGLTADERTAIEHGCGLRGVGDGSAPPTPGVTDTADSFVLRNVITDQGGRMGLLYGNRAALTCLIGEPGMPYNPAYIGMPYTGPPDEPVTVDAASRHAGGDAAAGKASYRGEPGYELVAGRVNGQVARVSLTQGERSVDASVANGTYLGRILYPADWRIPRNQPNAVVRAYDANGTLLATVGR